jgi:hypothetical protein
MTTYFRLSGEWFVGAGIILIVLGLLVLPVFAAEHSDAYCQHKLAVAKRLYRINAPHCASGCRYDGAILIACGEHISRYGDLPSAVMEYYQLPISQQICFHKLDELGL